MPDHNVSLVPAEVRGRASHGRTAYRVIRSLIHCGAHTGHVAASRRNLMTSTAGRQGHRPRSPHFEVVRGWGTLPAGYHFKEASSVAVDAKDNVYVFCRGEYPVIVFDREGNFLRAWGKGMFTRAHSVIVGPDEAIWLVDDAGHAIYKCSADGQVLMTLGTPGQGAPPQSGKPFNQPTHLGHRSPNWRPLHHGRLRELLRAQVRSIRPAPLLVGRRGE